MIRSAKTVSGSILLLLSVWAAACCQGSNSEFSLVTLHTAGGEEVVKAEVADTTEERARGLMFRQSLPEGTGMLFLFESESRGSFWMRNTPISLDLIFINDGRVVSIRENAVPYSDDLLTPDAAYTSVLEVPGGYTARHGVQVGDTVSVSD